MTWLRRLIIQILLLVAFHSIASGQLRNAVWCFGDSAGIDFSNMSNVHPFASAMDGRGTCVSIADSTGILLFYGFTRALGLPYPTGLLYNRFNKQLLNGDTIAGDGWYHEMIIVPNPDNLNQYYLLSSAVTSGGWTLGLYYSLIDMSGNNDSGAVIQKNVLIEPFSGVDAIAAVKHGNGSDWWIVTRDWDSYNDVIHIYLVDPYGIHIEPIQHIGSPSSNGVANMVFSKDGDKILITTNRGLIETIDFDRCSGQFSNANIIQFEDIGNPRHYWGSELSPDGTKLYLILHDTTSFLYQFDLTAPDIFASRQLIDSFPCPPYYAGGDLKRASDDKIYLSNAWYDGQTQNYPYSNSDYNLYNMNLGVINYPDSAGLSCQFSSYGFYLGGKRTYWGLPNNPNYDLGPMTGSLCDTLFTEVPNIPDQSTVQFHVNYQRAWQTLFVNASGLENGQYDLEIFNMNAGLIHKGKGRAVNGYYNGSIKLPDLASGLYVAMLIWGKGIISTKFVVE